MPTFRNTWHFQLYVFHFSVKSSIIVELSAGAVVFHSVVLIAEPQTQTNMLKASITDSFPHQQSCMMERHQQK